MIRALISLTLLSIASLLLACDRPSSQTAATGGGAPTPIELSQVRFVALSPALGLTLQDLGLEDQVVGAHDYDAALARSIPRVGSLDGIDYEALLQARPTHVLIELSKDKALPPRLASLGEQHGWVVRRFDSIDSLNDVARVMDDLYLDFVSPPEAGETNTIGFSDPSERFDKTMPSEAFARAIQDRGPSVRGAGRVLLLGELSPPYAIGPGTVHHQVLTRIGGRPAIEQGGMWLEMDTEDVVRLRPDAIVIVMPRDPIDDDRFVEAPRPGVDEQIKRLGRLGEQDIPAINQRRVALIDHPHSHVPAGSSMRAFAEELAAILEGWTAEDGASVP